MRSNKPLNGFKKSITMKRNRLNNILFATFIAGAFVACNDDDETVSIGTPYNANTSSIASVGAAVDLGLPSNTLWADKNVGAASAQDMGISFIWGDVTGTQLSIKADTYAQGTSPDVKDLFNSCKGELKSDKGNVQIAKLENIKVVAVDSVRPNFDCDIVIERHSYKDAEGNYVSKKDIKEDSEYDITPYTVKEGRVFMSNTEEGYVPALAKYLMSFGVSVADILEATGLADYDALKAATGNDYDEDQYNVYVVAKAEKVSYTDKIQKLVPVDPEINLAKVVAEAKAAAEKETAWSYFTEAVYNNADNYLHADFIVESEGVVSYNDGHDADIAGLSIIGDAKYDAATKNWGAEWAMPTTAQLNELIKECEWEYTGAGYKVTGPNGNSIFLPAAGYRYENTLIANGAAGYYASGEVSGKYTFPNSAEQNAGGFGSIGSIASMPNILLFNNGMFDNSKKIINSMADKNIGVSIRPVKAAK